MGTRHLTVIYDGECKPENELITIYGQYDGYPSGYGKLLKELVGAKKIVNGLNSKGGDEVANGMGCFAAQLVALLKIKQRNTAIQLARCNSRPVFTHSHDGMAGGYYIENSGTRDEQYIYNLYFVANPKEDQMIVAWELYQQEPEINPNPNDMIFEVGVIYLKLESGKDILYDGPLKDFDANYK